jgi:small subunit ribosomal protein S16
MLVIRLLRIGKKNQPSFKMVVTEKKSSPTKGTFIEDVGFWNPLTKERNVKKERIEYWMSVGAKPSDTVHNMLVEEGLITEDKKKKHNKKKKEEGEEDSNNKEKKEEGPKKETKEELESKEENKEETKEKEEAKEDKKEEETKKETEEPKEEKEGE